MTHRSAGWYSDQAGAHAGEYRRNQLQTGREYQDHPVPLFEPWVLTQKGCNRIKSLLKRPVGMPIHFPTIVIKKAVEKLIRQPLGPVGDAFKQLT